MTHTIEATERNWNEILRAKGLVLVDFWAPWCGFCRRLAPIFANLAAEYSGRATLATVNVDEQPALAERNGVQGIPALKFFVDGELVGDAVGFVPEAALRHRIDEVLARAKIGALA